MIEIDAFHLPGVPHTAQRHPIAQRDGVRASAPALSHAQLNALCDRLIAARAQLHVMPLARIIEAIDAATRRLREPRADPHRIVLESLTAITGYSRAMAELTLDRVCADWLAPTLHALVRAELGSAAEDAAVLPRGPGVQARIISPALALHIFSGNVPGVSVTSLVRSLLVRSAVIGKCAAAEPVLAPVFAQLLAQADPEVGACVAVTYWPGGDVEREGAVLSRVGILVHYGAADAIASARARAPHHVRVVEHGPRISFALVRLDTMSHAATQATAQQLAHAVACFDQQGCVSPQLAYVIGDPAAARAFAAAVAAALDELAVTLPRGRLEPAEAAAIHEARTRAEFGAIAGRDLQLWQGRDLSHTVIFTAEPAFEGTCLNRTLLVKLAASADHVISHAAPFAAFLQTVGVAGFAEHELDILTQRLGEIGVSRVTSPAAMPWPPATWHHDGRGPLRELVTWLDVEN